jgi:DNA-binding transcriptional ArsR family regulator
MTLALLDEILIALAEPTRRRVLERLAVHGETTATVLTRELPVSRQAIQQHLVVLDQAGLVSSSRLGRERRYRVETAPLRDTAAWLAKAAAAWDIRLAAIRDLAEARPEPGEQENG